MEKKKSDFNGLLPQHGNKASKQFVMSKID